VKLFLGAISPKRSRAKSGGAEILFNDYVARAARYLPCVGQLYPSESDFLATLDHHPGRSRPHLMLLDCRGQQFTSEAFAAHIGRLRDSGIQSLILAIGPADGWSPAARFRADSLLSLGPMTLPHELARVVLAEQVYRALTILAGSPYHRD